MSESKAEVSGVEVTLPDGTKKLMSLEDARKLYDSLGLLFGKEKEYVPFPMSPTIIIDRPIPSQWPLDYPIITWQGHPTTGVIASHEGDLEQSGYTPPGDIMCINMTNA